MAKGKNVLMETDSHEQMSYYIGQISWMSRTQTNMGMKENLNTKFDSIWFGLVWFMSIININPW